MSYLLSLSVPALAGFALLTLLWAAGGWLLACCAFDLQPRERLFAGLGLGWTLHIVLANLLANILPLTPAFWLSAALVAGLGALSAFSRPRAGWLPARADLRVLGWQAVALAALIVLFTGAQRGLALFDDYLHLPLVSVMAAGDIPPHFYLNPESYFAYHYGLQVYAAGMTRLARFFPWIAWDISKAIAIALTLALGWTWARRYLAQGRALAAAAVISLAGGARWLLLLLPQGVLEWIDGRLTLINTGADSAATLAKALSGPWVIEGGGRVPFPFAFHNGVFVPVIMVLGSTGAMPFVAALLLLLLAGRVARPWMAYLSLALVLASLALSAEHLFAFLWAGMALAWLLAWRLKRPAPRGWLAVLALAAALGAVQGGFITETLRGLFNPGQVTNAYSFSLRLPPGIYSAQLGVLSLLDPAQLLALLAELGPALLLAPPVTVYAWRSLRQGAWFEAAAGLTALLCFLFPLFFQYGVDRSITRLPGTALWLWVVLALPPLAKRLEDAPGRWRGWAAALALALSAGGLAVFAVQLTTLPDPQPSYFINPADARIARLHWDQLAPDARVFDRLPYRAVTLFGRADTAHRTIYFALPEWEALLADPDPARLAQAGYDYVYLDQDWFRALPVADQDALSGGCVQQVGEPQTYDKGKQERWLVDISGCGK